MHKDAVPSIDNIIGIEETNGLCPDRDVAYSLPSGSIAGLEFIFSGQLGPEFELFPPLEMCFAVTARIRANNTGNIFTYFNTALDHPVAGYLRITETSVTLSMPGTTATFDTSQINLADDTFKQIQVCTQASGFATLYVDCNQTGQAVHYLPQQYRLESIDGIMVLGDPFTGDTFQVSFCMHLCLRRLIAFVEAMYRAVMALVLCLIHI